MREREGKRSAASLEKGCNESPVLAVSSASFCHACRESSVRLENVIVRPVAIKKLLKAEKSICVKALLVSLAYVRFGFELVLAAVAD